jgi:hypothetical protein
MSQIAPLVAGLVGDRLVTPFRRRVALWCLVLFAGDGLYLMVNHAVGVNLSLGYVIPPLGAALALWALSQVHPDDVGRATIRWAILLQISVGVALTLTIEDTNTFSLVVSPFHALVVLLAAVWVFLRRGLSEMGALFRRDWFWMVGGVMVYSATLAALQPVSWYLRASGRPDLLQAVLAVKAGADIVAFAIITGGMFCRARPMSSGGSFSPASSPSPSSSPLSAPRW